MDTRWFLVLVSVAVVVLMPVVVQSELTSEYVSHSPHHLLLTCSTRGAFAPDTNVISIVINNTTASHGSRTLAWMTTDGVPKFGNDSAKTGSIFVAGAFRSAGRQDSVLHVLLMDHDTTRPAAFTCRITVHGHQAQISYKDFHTRVDAHSDAALSVRPEPASVSAPPAAKQTTLSPAESEDDETVRTGSVMQPTVVETGTPMYVVIVMLVFIALLIVVTTALLLQKFKERCSQHPGAYPSPYMLAGDGLEAWGDRMGGLKGSRRSLHTMVGLRSHYSLPRPLQPPPPPPPKMLRSKSRESGEYAGSPGPIPPGMTRSFHYTTPYDAIVHDEDGELSLLNTSAHCDVTPALPPELAGESTYKVPRMDVGETSPTANGQAQPVYACRPKMDTSFELE